MDFSIVTTIFRNKKRSFIFDNYNDCIFLNDNKLNIAENKDQLSIRNNIVEYDEYIYDYDNLNLKNPINANDILIKWNLLQDVAVVLKKYFLGNEKYFDKLYDYLFKCSTCVDNTTLFRLKEKDIIKLKRIFKNGSKILNKLYSMKI